MVRRLRQPVHTVLAEQLPAGAAGGVAEPADAAGAAGAG